MKLHDLVNSFEDSVDGLVHVSRQEIPEGFLQACREARDESIHAAQELHQVAAIPTAVVELWLRQGFNVYREPARAIVARLKHDGLDAFLTSKKRI